MERYNMELKEAKSTLEANGYERKDETMSKLERIYKRIYNDAKNYNLAQCIESKLTYITILNNELEFLVNIGVIDRYDILRDKNDYERIFEIILQYKGYKTIDIIVD